MSPLLATTAIVGATIVNLDGGPHRTNAVVVIEDERIREIASAAPAGAEIRRADGLFLLPGLVNLHVHLGLVLPGKMAAELASESDAALALRMAANARRSLE
ncbi:MAG TPA: amidohydrolase family protein, partial [Vicinamibacteria bacterium]|nr:amidohydrolase family protein [Vicinamibacteria bacterium]